MLETANLISFAHGLRLGLGLREWAGRPAQRADTAVPPVLLVVKEFPQLFIHHVAPPNIVYSNIISYITILRRASSTAARQPEAVDSI